MQITIHRGTHRIGGCVTEIKSSAARIIIDMGASLSPEQAESNASLHIDGVTCGEPDCDGVLITHCHGDHVGLFESFANTDIYRLCRKTNLQARTANSKRQTRQRQSGAGRNFQRIRSGTAAVL